MSLTPKNWKTFQHYSDRKPAWIKLHHGLLDDFSYASLPLASQALAPRLWLLASEYIDGKITASLDEIAFRVHVTVDELTDALKPLVDTGFFIDDSNLLADCEQVAIPEREIQEETQTQTEREISSLRSERALTFSREKPESDFPSDAFDRFYEAYPRKQKPKPARKAFDKVRKSGEVTFARLMAAVARIPRNEPKFIPHPASWLNAGSWDDQPLPSNGAKNGSSTPSERAYQFAARARELEIAAGIGRSPDAVGGDDGGGGFAGAIPNGSGRHV